MKGGRRRSGRAGRSEPNYAERLAADFADSSDYRSGSQRPDNCSHQSGVGQSTRLRRLATDRRHRKTTLGAMRFTSDLCSRQLTTTTINTVAAFLLLVLLLPMLLLLQLLRLLLLLALLLLILLLIGPLLLLLMLLLALFYCDYYYQYQYRSMSLPLPYHYS